MLACAGHSTFGWDRDQRFASLWSLAFAGSQWRCIFGSSNICGEGFTKAKEEAYPLAAVWANLSHSGCRLAGSCGRCEACTPRHWGLVWRTLNDVVKPVHCQLSYQIALQTIDKLHG